MPLKILILKPSSLGDVIQALPLLRLLKLRFPAAEIHWWIASDLAPLLAGDPDLHGLFLFERRKWIAPQHWHELLDSLREMRAVKFDWVIDLQGLARSGVFAWLANGKFTIGVDSGREGARGFCDEIVPRPSPQTHAVDWYLAVLTRLGVPVHPHFTWLPERAPIAANLREKWAVNSSRWLALVPGARWANKRWPQEHFAELVRQLASEHRDVRFAILGGRDDGPFAAAIARAAPERCLDLTGATSLPEMIEWVRLCELTITNDTGPMHVAAALGKPVVALFGPTAPWQTGPYGQITQALRVPLPCSPCMKATCRNENPLECLHTLTPDRVRRAVGAQASRLRNA